ncbi:MAG: hypothetical protein RR186_02095 [Raoultibacter sp.]
MNLQVKTSQKVVLLIAAVLIASLTLVACGTDSAKNFIGSWKLDSMQSGNTTLPAETIEKMGYKDLYDLELKEDNTASITISGFTVLGTWEVKDATTATVSYSNNTSEMTYKDGKLSMGINGDSTVLIMSRS